MKAKDIEVPVVKRIHKLFDVCYYFALTHSHTHAQLVIDLMNLRYLMVGGVMVGH